MNKTVLTLVFIAAGCAAVYAQNNPVSDAFEQSRNAQNEQRTQTNENTKAIEALRKQVAANKTATTDEKPTSQRYLLAEQNCKELRAMPVSEQKKFAAKYDAMTEQDFKARMWDCYDPNWRRDSYYQRAVQQSQERNSPAADAAAPPAPAPQGQEVDNQRSVQVAQAYLPGASPMAMYGGDYNRFHRYQYRNQYYRRYEYHTQVVRPVTRTIETVPPELRSTSYRCNPDGSPAMPGTGWCHRN